MNDAHHWGWIAVVLIIFCGGTYIFTVNRPDVQKGGYQADYHRQDWPFSFHIGEGGCAHFDGMKRVGNEVRVKEK